MSDERIRPIVRLSEFRREPIPQDRFDALESAAVKASDAFNQSFAAFQNRRRIERRASRGRQLADPMEDIGVPGYSRDNMAMYFAFTTERKRFKVRAREGIQEPAQNSGSRTEGEPIDLSKRFAERARVREALMSPVDDDPELPPVS